MRRGRKPLIVLGVIVAVVVIAALALRYLVPVETLAEQAVARVRADTGAEVTYGPVSLDLWPRVAVSVEGLAVSLDGDDLAARGEDPGALVSVRAAAARIEAELAWGPLLRRRVEVGRVLVERPEIDLVTRVDTTAAVVESEETPAASSLAVVLAGIAVRDGRFAWSEEGSGRAVTLTGWRQDVELDELGALARRLTAFGAGEPAPAPAEESTSPSRLALDGEVAMLEAVGLQPDTSWSLEDLDLDVTLAVAADGSRIDIGETQLSWGGTDVTAAGAAYPTGPGVFRLDLDWGLVALDQGAVQRALPGFMPELAEPWPTWLARAPVAIDELTATGGYDAVLPPAPDASPAETMRGLSATIAVRGAMFTPPVTPALRTSPPWRVDADVAIADGRLVVSDLVATVDAGTLTGGLELEPLGAPDAAVTLDARLENLPSAVVLGAVVPSVAAYVEGAMAGEVRGSLRLGEPEAVRSSLNLDGEALLTSGVVHGTEWLAGIGRYLGDRQDLMEIEYDAFKHHLKVRDGRYVVDDLALEGRDTDWRGDGWIGLDGTIDLDLAVKLPADFRPQLGAATLLAESLRGEDGRMLLEMNLSGRSARPAVSVDLSAATDRLQDTVSDGINRFLDNLRRRE